MGRGQLWILCGGTAFDRSEIPDGDDPEVLLLRLVIWKDNGGISRLGKRIRLWPGAHAGWVCRRSGGGQPFGVGALHRGKVGICVDLAPPIADWRTRKKYSWVRAERRRKNNRLRIFDGQQATSDLPRATRRQQSGFACPNHEAQ